MTWWLWIALGLVLAAFELATPGGFFIIFFGIAALVVGVLDLLDLIPQPWFQWLVFPLVALVALRLFRRPLLERMRLNDHGADDVDTVVGTVALAAGHMGPGAHGQAELRGTRWSARNVDTVPLVPGQRCRVVAVQGLMLELRSE
jgi:inner membrane protein